MNNKSDVTILGGGLAGLSLALHVRKMLPKASIIVLEKNKHPVPEAAFKVGESTVEVAAHYFGEILGLRQHILEEQLPKLGLRFFFPAGDNRSIENRRELGGTRYAPCPSYQLDRGRLENFLSERCLSQGIEFIDEASVEEMASGRRGHRVTYRRNNRSHAIHSRWLVDASGRRALLKRQLGLELKSPHLANAAWFRVKKHIKIDDWSHDPRWQEGHSGNTGRWYSTNHLMGEGYWVWLIPLASGSTSIGIVAAEEFHPLTEFNSMEKATSWLTRYEPQCAEAINQNLEHVQDFRAIKHYAVECKQVFSASRWGITGEAGFFHDPFYSPGSDFIAFANTFLVDVIRRDLSGQGYRIRAFTYDRIFKRFFYGTAAAYQDQYRIFGNSTVMPIKILWDYLVYWSITGFIFMQGRTCRQMAYVRNVSKLSRLGRLNHFMQGFFRQWHELAPDGDAHGKIDISRIPLIREMNERLLQEMSDAEFARQFAKNLSQLETLSGEIVSQSGLEVAVPVKAQPRPGVKRNVLASIFQTDSAASPEPLELVTGSDKRRAS